MCRCRRPKSTTLCSARSTAPRCSSPPTRFARGVEPGAYHYRPEAHALELLKAGRYRNESAHLCLEQPLGGDAAAVIYFLAPLDRILPAFGNRGYRLANLEAGIAGGRAYLAAYTQGFGASGLTFHGRHRGEVFSPPAAGKDAIFVTAC